MSDYRDSNDPMYGYEPPDRTGIWGSAIGWLRTLKALHPHVQRFALCQSRHCSDVLLLESRTLAAMRLGVFPLTGGRS